MYLRPWTLGYCPCSPAPVVRPSLGLGGGPRRMITAPVLPMPRRTGMGGGIPISVQAIRDGKLGTRDTIREMGRLAVAAAHDPTFVAWVRGQVSDLKSKDYSGEAQRIFDIVHNHVRYVRDPMGLEVVQDPRAVLFQDGTGDCDEHATTIAAMALALGHRAAFRTVAATHEINPKTGKAERVDEWSHVYALIGLDDPYAKDGTKWIPADSTQSNATLGWEPSDDRVWMKKDWVVF